MAESPFHFRPYLVAQDLDPGLLRATRISSRERVSHGCAYQVWATCDYGTVEVRSLLRQPAAIVVVREDGSLVRRLAGVVTRASERATTVEGRQDVSITIEDPMALLRLSSDHRIFQEMTTQEIVQTILDAAGIEGEFRLSGGSRKRVVCTQYGETMRSFVDRLLEEDGIFWFVEQGDESPKIVFGDAPSSWSETPFDPTIRYRHGAGLHPEEALDKLDLRARVRPSKFTLRDHDFEKPTLDLTQVVESQTALGREHYEYPGRYVVPAEGKTRAKAVANAHVARATAAHAGGHVFRMTAGHAFDLEDSPGAAHDGAWVALSVEHDWHHGGSGQPRLDTSATILPKDAPFAPEPRTPKPRALGDLGLVTTPSGEEIHTDKHGRVKVFFLWDRHAEQDDKSSAWIRVGQMHTSGSVVIPRAGWEVLVEYEDGDPDRPVVLGRLWNGATPPLDALPGKSTNSTLVSYSTPGGEGYNEIRMDDGGGSELVQVHAQKDLNLVVANNKEETVGTTAAVGVAANETISVGANETTRVGSKDQVDVGGSQTYQVNAARTKTVSKDEKVDVKGDRTVTIAASHTTTTPKSVETSTQGNLTETVGGSNMEVAALGVALAVAGSASITVGGAKVEAVATGKTDTNVGAKASTVGGALLNVTPKDVSVSTKASKTTTVGGAWLGNAGAEAEISSKSAVEITVGGALAFTGAKIVLKVGGSTVTIANGAVVLDSKEVKLTASGPAAELAALVGSK